jgi:UDP-2,3-diacylglucosamine pyrophosphatase LpxH
MTRTLVISDLHIGARGRSSVLVRSDPLERLLSAIDGIERLVLLGDIVELMESRPRAAIETALPILRAIGLRLGRERQAVVVPGNHDRLLVRPWLRRHGRTLTADTRLPRDAGPMLAAVVDALAPAEVEVRYPGVWLREDVWATHGHYLDRHLFPVSAWGLVRGPRHRLPRERATPWDYEQAGRAHLSPLVRWMPSTMAAGFEELADLARAATMPRVHRAVLRPHLSPVISGLLSTQMRRHSLPALARVVHHLGVEADAVVFGHVHRTGPLTDDDPGEWRAPGEDGPRLFNTGSWLHEPRLVHRAVPPHPYWPGGAVVLAGGEPPRALSLLDDLAVEQLTSRARGAAIPPHGIAARRR